MTTKRRILTGPLAPVLIDETSKWLQALGAEFNFSLQDMYRMELCFAELVPNIVDYSDPQYADQPVELYAVIESRKVTLTLSDPAAPFDPFSVPPPRVVKSIEEMQVSGHGIHIVREFSNSFRYERRANKNRAELVFELEQTTHTHSRPVEIPRNIDRRRNIETPVFPLVCEGVVIALDRRKPEDRRSLGFISWSQIFHGIPYATIENMIERLPIQDIVGEMQLLKPGSKNDAVLTVLRGKLKVSLDQPGNGDSIEVGAGGCVGEMSVIDNQPASAYVTAEPGTRLLLIDSSTFINDIMCIPSASRNLMSALTARMRYSNELAIKRMRKELEMEQTQRELQYARSIQESLLPKEPLFPDDPRLDCAGRMVTAREVGGDFYDIFALDKRYVFFVIADVCGKGLPAALFMVRAIAALRAQSGNEEQSAEYAAQLMARLNYQLCAYNDAQQFLTAFCGILDLETLTLRYINAAHNAPAIAIGNGPFHYLTEPINPMVGMIEGLAYRTGEIKLQPGSALLLYTDGVTEAENKEGHMLGDDPLLARLNAVAKRSAGQLVEEVFDEVRGFAMDAQQSDDITVLAIRCA